VNGLFAAVNVIWYADLDGMYLLWETVGDLVEGYITSYKTDESQAYQQSARSCHLDTTDSEANSFPTSSELSSL
jgi:hypothetical protein